MITGPEARTLAALAQRMYSDGFTDDEISEEVRKRGPISLSASEVDAILARGYAAATQLAEINLGVPPVNVSLPSAVAGSSTTPAMSPSNPITIDVRVKIEQAGKPDKYRILRVHGVSGSSWSDFEEDIGDVIDEWETEYEGSTVSVVEYLRMF